MAINVVDVFSILFLWIPINWFALLLYVNYNFTKDGSMQMLSGTTPNSNLRLNVSSLLSSFTI